jgi:hypothetical protein
MTEEEFVTLASVGQPPTPEYFAYDAMLNVANASSRANPMSPTPPAVLSTTTAGFIAPRLRSRAGQALILGFWATMPSSANSRPPSDTCLAEPTSRRAPSTWSTAPPGRCSTCTRQASDFGVPDRVTLCTH